MSRIIARSGRVLLIATAASVFAINSAAIAQADPAPQGVCATVVSGSSSWCPLYASGTAPSDSRADGMVAITGSSVVISTRDNGQGNTTLGAAPDESVACIYTGTDANREPRLKNLSDCSSVGGIYVHWTGTNSSAATDMSSEIAKSTDGYVYIWVEAHPKSNNGNGTPFHNQLAVQLPSTPAPVGTVGSIAAALAIGGVLMWRLRRRASIR